MQQGITRTGLGFDIGASPALVYYSGLLFRIDTHPHALKTCPQSTPSQKQAGLRVLMGYSSPFQPYVPGSLQAHMPSSACTQLVNWNATEEIETPKDNNGYLNRAPTLGNCSYNRCILNDAKPQAFQHFRTTSCNINFHNQELMQ